MSELHATKTRLAILRAVADGDVREVYPLLPDPQYSEMDCGGVTGPRYVKVTAKVNELGRAGWVRLGPREGSVWSHSPRRWELTDAGRAVLDGAQ